MRSSTPFTAGILGLLLASACGYSFDVEIESETIVERGTLVEQLFPMVFDEFVTVDLSETEEFENRDVRPSMIESVRMTSFVLQISHPEDVDFSFLRSIEFHIEAEGEPRRLIARSPEDAFGAGVREVELEIEEVELLPYAVSDHFSLTSVVSASRRPAKDTTVRAEVVFEIQI